jgi:hypothetical protein
VGGEHEVGVRKRRSSRQKAGFALIGTALFTPFSDIQGSK